MKALTDLLSAPWLGTTLGIAGLLAALYFYLKSKRFSKIAYQTDETSIVGGSSSAFPQEVEILFAGSKVDEVTATRIVFWNAGSETVDGRQIVSADPLRLELSSNGAILKAEALSVVRDVNGLRLEVDDSSKKFVNIMFDFLDPKDGISIEVIHSGPKGNMKLKGTIRGLQEGAFDLGKIHDTTNATILRFGIFPRLRLRPLLVWFSGFIGFTFISFGLFSSLMDKFLPTLTIIAPKTIALQSVGWAMTIAGLPYALLPIVIHLLRRRRYPAVLEPRSASSAHSVISKSNIDKANAS